MLNIFLHMLMIEVRKPNIFMSKFRISSYVVRHNYKLENTNYRFESNKWC